MPARTATPRRSTRAPHIAAALARTPASSHTTTGSAAAPMQDDDRSIAVRLRERHVEKRKAQEMERKSRPASPPSGEASDAGDSADELESFRDASDSEPVIETKAPRKAASRRRQHRPNATHAGLEKVVCDWLQSASRHPALHARGTLPPLSSTIRAWLVDPSDRWVDKIRLRAGLSELMPRLRDAAPAEREQVISAVIGALDGQVESRNGSQASIARLLIRSGHHLGDALLPVTRQLVRELGPCTWRTHNQLNSKSRHYDSSFVNELLTTGAWKHNAAIWLGILQELPDAPDRRRGAVIAQLQKAALRAGNEAWQAQISRNFHHALASFHGGADMPGSQLSQLVTALFAPSDKPVTDKALCGAFRGLCEALSLDGWKPEHRDWLVRHWLGPQDDGTLTQRTTWMVTALLQPVPSRPALRDLLDRALEGAETGPTPRQNALLLHIIRSLRDDPALEAQTFARLAPELGEQLGLHLASTPGPAGQALAVGAHEALRQFPATAAHGFMAGLVQSLAATGMLADDACLTVITHLIAPTGAAIQDHTWTFIDEQGHRAHGALEGAFEGLVRHGRDLAPARLRALARAVSPGVTGSAAIEDVLPWRHPAFHTIAQHPGGLSADQTRALAQGAAEGLLNEARRLGITRSTTRAACTTAHHLRGPRQQALVEGYVQGLGGPAMPLQQARLVYLGLCDGLTTLPDGPVRLQVIDRFLHALGGAQMPRALAWALLRVAAKQQSAGHEVGLREAAQVLEAAARQTLGEAAFQAARAQAGIRWDHPGRFAGVTADRLRLDAIVQRFPVDAKENSATAQGPVRPDSLCAQELQAADAWLAMLRMWGHLAAQYRALTEQRAKLNSESDLLAKQVQRAQAGTGDVKSAQAEDLARLAGLQKVLSGAKTAWEDIARTFERELDRFSLEVLELMQARKLLDRDLQPDATLRHSAFESFQSRYAPDLDAAGWLRDSVAMGLKLGVHRLSKLTNEIVRLRLERLRAHAADGDTPMGHDPVLAGLLFAADRPSAFKRVLIHDLLQATCQEALRTLLQWPPGPGDAGGAATRTLACVLQTMRLATSGDALLDWTLEVLKTLPGTQPVAPEALAGWAGTVVDTLGLTTGSGRWLDLVAALPGWITRYTPRALGAAAAAVSARLQADAGHFPQRLAEALSRLGREQQTAIGQQAAALQAVISGLCPTHQPAQAFLQAVEGLGLPALETLMRPAAGIEAGAECAALFEEQVPARLAGGSDGDAPVRLVDLAWFLGRRRLAGAGLRALARKHLPAGETRSAVLAPWLRAARIADTPLEVMRERSMPLEARRALLQALVTQHEAQDAGSTWLAWKAAASGDLPDTSKSGALVTLTPMVLYLLGRSEFRTMRLQLMDDISALQARASQSVPPLSHDERADLELRITECSNDLAGLYMQWRHLPPLAFVYQATGPASPHAATSQEAPTGLVNRQRAHEALAFLDAELAAVRRPHVHPLTATLLATAINTLREPLQALFPPALTASRDAGLVTD